MEKNYYCCFGSPSTEFNDVNLQLYSLRKAAECWNELVHSLKEGDYGDSQKEKQVFIINCFGISLAQLLGQNYPSDSYSKIILKNLLDTHEIEPDKKRRINNIFCEFNEYYNATHHFGKRRHDKISKLTVDELDMFRSMTIDIWDIVCGLFDENYANHSVAEVIIFNELPPKGKKGAL